MSTLIVTGIQNKKVTYIHQPRILIIINDKPDFIFNGDKIFVYIIHYTCIKKNYVLQITDSIFFYIFMWNILTYTVIICEYTRWLNIPLFRLKIKSKLHVNWRFTSISYIEYK